MNQGNKTASVISSGGNNQVPLQMNKTLDEDLQSLQQ